MGQQRTLASLAWQTKGRVTRRARFLEREPCLQSGATPRAARSVSLAPRSLRDRRLQVEHHSGRALIPNSESDR